MNDLLPDAARIVRRFETADIPIDDTFGSSSDEPLVPSRLVIAWGTDVDPARLREIIAALKGIRIDAISATGEPEDRKQIFVGSYVVSGPGVFDLTPEVRRSLTSRSLTQGDLERIGDKGHQLRALK